MKKWAAGETDAETAEALRTCELGDSPNFELAPLCGEWFVKWNDAGRP